MTTPQTPAPDTVAGLIRATVDRLNLDDTRAAAYFGVPVFTVRKWLTGQREPGAAVARLVEVLGLIEALAPALHENLIPDAHVSKVPRKSKRHVEKVPAKSNAHVGKVPAESETQ